VLGLPSSVGYAGIALLVGGESAGLAIPGETSLIAGAVLASQGRLSLPLVITVGATAAIAGDNVGYLIGRRGGRWLLTRPGRGRRTRQRLLAQSEAFFARHGAKAVFLGRWLPGLRITAAWLAGTSRMRWLRFLLWNALGGVAWAASVGIAAYLLGSAAGTGLALIALVVVAGVLAYAAGTRIATRVPSPGTEATSIVPPAASMRTRCEASPTCPSASRSASRSDENP
jgi:membrane-associated protein